MKKRAYVKMISFVLSISTNNILFSLCSFSAVYEPTTFQYSPEGYGREFWNFIR